MGDTIAPMPKLTRVRAVPWLLVFQAARAAQAHLLDVTTPADRRRVKEIVGRSKGDPRQVTQRDRDELQRIARNLDLRRLAGELAPLGMRHRRRRF